MRTRRRPSRHDPERGLGVALLALGGPAALLAWGVAPGSTAAAASADWPPFVLVAGLLLLGVVADADGLFAALGDHLGRRVQKPLVAFGLGMALIAAVTAVLNLDTSVTFLTPVLVHRARRRGEDPAPLLYGCLLGSNAASLLLPGSNLTNLLLLGPLHAPPSALAGAMGLPFLAGLLVVSTVVALGHRGALAAAPGDLRPEPRPLRVGIGALGTIAVLADVLLVANPAPGAIAIGALAAGYTVGRGRLRTKAAWDALALPILLGLFGVAVALGALGRHLDLAALLDHLDAFGAAGLAAGLSLLVNNLPAASLLQAAHPARPEALLLGLDLGPNAFATGSLAWLLWWRAAALAGARPSIRHASALGLVATPVAIALGVVLLNAAGGH